MKHEMKRLSAILRLLRSGHLPVPAALKDSLRTIEFGPRRKQTHLLHAHVLARARNWPSH